MSHSTYHAPIPRTIRSAASVGLTDAAVIDAYVTRRVQDPSLLSSGGVPRYADFFTPGHAAHRS